MTTATSDYLNQPVHSLAEVLQARRTQLACLENKNVLTERDYATMRMLRWQIDALDPPEQRRARYGAEMLAAVTGRSGA